MLQVGSLWRTNNLVPHSFLEAFKQACPISVRPGIRFLHMLQLGNPMADGFFFGAIQLP